MAAPAPRRFGLLDAMILVAATAVGAASLRSFPNKRGIGIPFPGPDDTVCVVLDTSLEFIEPCLVPLTFAVLLIRLRRPRPVWRRLMRQPGMAACVAVTGVLLAASAVAGINFAIVAVLPEDEFQEMLRKLCIAAGASVGAVWLVLALGKLCRSEGGWIDRLGRVLGACWILVFFTAILSDFWWTSITSKNNQEAFQRFKSIPKGEKLYQESYESVPEAAKSGQKLNREPDVANRGIEEPQREPKLPHRPVDGATRSAPDVKPGTGAKEP